MFKYKEYNHGNKVTYSTITNIDRDDKCLNKMVQNSNKFKN